MLSARQGGHVTGQSQFWSILLYVEIAQHPPSHYLLFWQIWFTMWVSKALYFNATASCVVYSALKKVFEALSAYSV